MDKQVNPNQPMPHSTPQQALEDIRAKMVDITYEYSSGALNAEQFNAMYRHYVEKRKIIELLIERDPQTDAWRRPASPGLTTYLRSQFEAKLLYVLVFRRGDHTPLLAMGQIPRSAARQVYRLLNVMWSLQNWRSGVARKAMGKKRWLIMVVGEHSYTITVFQMQPSTLQVNEVCDLQRDFERANRAALLRGDPASRMVFPQRALME